MPAKSAAKTWKKPDPARVEAILAGLEGLYPDATCALHFSSPWELLVATILSAQCTDERVNMVTPDFFKRWPNVGDAAKADVAAIEDVIRSTGFFRNKAKSISGAAKAIVEKHGGELPRNLEELVKLPGVGRKTANVVLGNAFGVPGITVDTHVKRICTMLELTDQKDPDKIERQLMEIIPRQRWTMFSHQVIWHGRRVCIARRPKCAECALLPLCPHGQGAVS